jgi:multidrug efflux pump subunit AcrA (membrane-fusion protein)
MRRRRWLRWLLGGVMALGLVAAITLYFGLLPNPWQPERPVEMGIDEQNPTLPAVETAPVQRAEQFLLDLTVGGKLEFRTIYEIKAPFEETVDAVPAEPGATVRAGDLLVALNRSKLTSQLDTTWLELTKARQTLRELMQGANLAALEAQAELLTAQEELAKLEKGPPAADRQGAQLAIADAQLAYDQLLKRNDPNSQKVREARFALRQAEDTLQRAQVAYNAVVWKGEIGASSEAAALQSATLAHESARNAYEEAIKPPTELELQKAQLDIAKAQSEYAKLTTQASPAQLEQAQVRVAKAQDKLAQLAQGPAPIQVQEAEAKVLEALTNFEETRTRLLSASNLQAPVDGLVVKVAVKPDQVVKAGDTVAALAVPDQFKLTLPVSELYILRVTQGMTVNVVLDVLPDTPITGLVASFAPIEVPISSDATSSSAPGGGAQLTTYPVIVHVTDSPLSQQLRAGMSAQVTFVGTNQLAPNSWLVPANALDSQEEGPATIQLMRGETPVPLTVTVTGQTLGEWVVVFSPDLQEGDMVVGSTTSFLDAGGGSPFGP